MDERKKHIDEFFREQMSDGTETPPSSVWNSLEQRLDAAAPAPVKRPFPFWWFWVIGGLVVLSATAIIAGQINSADRQQIAAVSEKPTSSPQIVTNNAIPEDIEENTAPVTASTQENVPQSASNNDSPTPTSSEVSLPSSNSERVSQKQLPKIKKKSPEYIAGEHNAQETRTPSVIQPQLRESSSEGALLAMQSPHTIASRTEQSAIENRVVVPQLEVKLPSPDMSVRQPVTIEKMQQDEPLYAAAKTPVLNTFEEEQDAYVAQSSVQVQVLEDTTKKKKKIKVVKDDDGLYDADTSILNDVVEEVVTNVRRNIQIPFEAGIKLGFSKGFNNGWRADRFVLAPYLSYNLPMNLSLSIQPAYAYGSVNSSALDNSDRSYYEITGNTFDSSSRIVRGRIDSSVVSPNPPDTAFYTYTYGQTYDSVHVSYATNQKTLWEVELPLILKYKINKTFSVFAGGMATYSSVLQIQENVDRYSGLTKSYIQQADPQTFYVTAPNQPPPSGPARLNPDDLFSYTNSDPFDEYEASPAFNTSRKTFIRYGYMIGVSATLQERWMIDLMMHQSGVDGAAVPDKRVQKLYTQPYFRLMIGYKLFK